ncbi:hypothetical protein AC578_4201 [Pseudocercospora eumusae]|uniref:Uncharacterized protein n=1 Tax=Pseudocercospora eumusae TaxID=321146 RepID=A0A139HJ20_9PEZI|nr:hypothetical protein AC578_4201 [Pseudocercospora eumusae]
MFSIAECVFSTRPSPLLESSQKSELRFRRRVPITVPVPSTTQGISISCCANFDSLLQRNATHRIASHRPRPRRRGPSHPFAPLLAIYIHERHQPSSGALRDSSSRVGETVDDILAHSNTPTLAHQRRSPYRDATRQKEGKGNGKGPGPGPGPGPVRASDRPGV